MKTEDQSGLDYVPEYLPEGNKARLIVRVYDGSDGEELDKLTITAVKGALSKPQRARLWDGLGPALERAHAPQPEAIEAPAAPEPVADAPAPKPEPGSS